ncbi:MULTISPECIES: BCCT family transporter [Marinobacter]|jgi:glycine betaine transporter|uniref:BCCT family transporter n=1 Tax=Marinobacter TaxID=2742 RepID=UPI0009FA0B00|nr:MULTISPECIES: BCCT family transporter [Marinobacter]MCD1630249.1 BCCT family transporter [Marinobacter shengliensis]QFS85457.1 Glycine betaine transporter OpuD [Marinobacter sp. THAF197a]QFT49251.1 Glycine betaine transporter OpuD [Marinobacter sp. THAF39]
MSHRPGWVFYCSFVLLVLFVVAGGLMPAGLSRYAHEALEFTTLHFGWLYLFATSGFLVFCIAVAAGNYGKIRLGADGEAPEFSYLTWLGMIFSAGMGVGLVFWAVAEPMSHFVAPPFDSAEPRGPQAASMAMRYSLFHWGFHQWANFALVGLAIAYVRFRLQRPGLISEAFRSTLGNRVDSGIGHSINILAVVSTVFGVATTLGLGVIQINSGLGAVAGTAFGVTQQLFILAGVAVVFLLCSLAPLESGIRYVSDANMLLAAGLLVFVFFMGPTDFITAAMTNAIGDYFANMVGMSLVMTPYTGDDWVERWTIFYWAWGLSWAPFVGSFIARISRGRTIREFVFGVIGMPVLLSIVWFSTFGGSALYFELFEGAALGDAVLAEMSSALFATLDYLPGTAVIGGLMLVLIVLFVITSANSATFVLGMFTSKGVLNPKRWSRLTWGIVQVSVAGVLLLSGGLEALQTISILAAFPFMVLMIFMAVALLKSLRNEQRQIELHEAMTKERLLRLLAENDHLGDERAGSEPGLKPEEPGKNE